MSDAPPVATYTYDAAWEHERERLGGIERLWDAGTTDLLEQLGVSAGWRCLEIGAGGGSVAEWLCRRVGPTGSVVATDLDTRFIDAIEAHNLTTHRLDVLADDAPSRDFDVVHARLLVEHVGTAAIPRLIDALRPGGVLVLEDYDMASVAVWPDEPLITRATGAVIEIMVANGFDPWFGRKLVGELSAAGLTDVDAAGRLRVVRGGTPETAFSRLTIAALRDLIVAGGAMTADEVAAALGRLEDPALTLVSPTMIAAWGRRPG